MRRRQVIAKAGVATATALGLAGCAAQCEEYDDGECEYEDDDDDEWEEEEDDDWDSVSQNAQEIEAQLQSDLSALGYDHNVEAYVEQTTKGPTETVEVSNPDGSRLVAVTTFENKRFQSFDSDDYDRIIGIVEARE